MSTPSGEDQFQIARRSDVVGVSPNDRSVIRLIGALLIEQDDEWLLGRGYLSEEAIGHLLEEATGAAGRRWKLRRAKRSSR